MAVKDDIIAMLERHRGEYISGEQMALELEVSRAAIWKAVKSLKEIGYRIEAISNRGYRLAPEDDTLSSADICERLGPAARNMKVEAFQCVTSTNTLARERADAGEPEGLVIVAGEQSEGRGRFSRPFFSPADTGLYLSILLRPQVTAQESGLITSVAAVAVAEAIEDVVGGQVGIKWVNDVYVDAHKVCGILTEASVDMETGCLGYAILGIGMNVYEPDGGFPDEIADRAGAISETRGPGLKNKLAASVLEHFMGYYLHLGDRAFLDAYRKRSFVPGQDIEIFDGTSYASAHALEIDDDLRLKVRMDDGREVFLQSGEVSIKVGG